MDQRYIILRQALPSELNRDQVRRIIADYYRLDPDEVLISDAVPVDRVCLIRTKVKDENGKVVGVQG